ncbi:methyl-accepting chemotaxis protein [Herbaspirillum autotrophicum]|uniref:methyl-accepting chemotaxis protein n=1 Tax=Herbaspirillum autotrophicum TaxID=180195 RepID=UPI00067BE0BF|nr:methyl-accepting chemotaxis protein [Herbaspirillum autotrophicum]
MDKLSFKQKLWLPLIISLIALLSISLFNAFQARNIRIEERKSDLINVTQVALSVVKQYAAQAQSGELNKDEAQKRALASLKSMRYGVDGYFSVTNPSEVMLMHPFKAEMNGKKMTDFKDPAGNPLFVNITKAASQPAGGFVSYLWPKAGATDPVPKTSFALSYQPWEWILTTGVYMDDINAAFLRSLYEVAGLLALITLFLCVIVVFNNRSILRTIGGDPAHAADVANRISDGDLSLSIDTAASDNKSLLFAIKRMRDSLLQTITDIKSSAHTIATASSEIASGNLDLSNRTEQQAGSLEETASAMEELTSTVKQNADNARQANQLAVSASEVAIQGGSVVGQVIDTMASINESSRKIVDIISVIDGIAFQTNILALNAAVEAARAGEQGRGFAVVASEVRSLAQRSAAAAKEIKTLIDDSVEKVGNGSKLVEQAGATMNEVVSSVRRVTDIVGEISSASQEQSAGINEVGQAITQMDESTQQNAALVEQAAAAAQSLQDQAGTLAQLIGKFKLDQNQISTHVQSAVPVSRAVSPSAPRPAAPAKASVPARAQAKAAAPTAPRLAPATRPAPAATPAPKSSPSSKSPPAADDGDWETF